MKRTYSIGLAVWLLALLSSCLPRDESIRIEDAWARPALAGETSAIYVRITSLQKDDALVGADTPAASRAELHRSILNDDGTMKMEQQRLIALPVRETIELLPGGLHIMLLVLHQDLTPGDELVLILQFEELDELQIYVPVQSP